MDPRFLHSRRPRPWRAPTKRAILQPRGTTMRTLVLGLTILLCGCSSGGADNGSSTGGPEACVQAGGQCLLGSAVATGACPVIGPQDCNPERNPGGAVCCLP